MPRRQRRPASSLLRAVPLPALRKRLAATGSATRPVFGTVLVLFAVLVLIGLDKRIETVATAALPESWVDLIVRF